MIVAVSSVLNEVDIIATTIAHLRDQGIDNILISDGGSTDGTWDLVADLADGYLTQDGPFDQGAEITRLAHIARENGAEWVLPFDADEFWIDPTGGTVSQVLCQLPANISQVYAATYGHLDWDRRLPQKPLSKVCFRPSPDMTVSWGNHHIYGVPGEELHGVLEVRELQYRDFGHFLAKVQKARDLFATWDVPIEHGYHMRVLTQMTDTQLAAEWAAYQAQPSTYFPFT